MKILISATFNANMTESKVKPLIILPEVEQIFCVSDKIGPCLEKVRYYCVPPYILKLCNNNAIIRAAYKFLIIFYLALFKRPDLLIGYNFVPHGINVEITGKVLSIPSCVNMIGGSVGIQGRDFTTEKSAVARGIKNCLGKLFLRIAKWCYLIIVTGSTSKNFLISKGGVRGDKIKIISATVDVKRFFPACSEKKYDLITIAQLIPTKKIEVFLEIVSRLAKHNFKIRALILGEGFLRGYLEELSERKGLKGIVEFAGFRPDVERYLNASKIFLFPTVKEGLSLAMLEAMACGVVPVVSDVDDLSDAVKDRVNGRLLNKDDINGFIATVSELLINPEILRRYSYNAIEFIRNNYTIENAGQKWKEILVSA